MVGKNRNDLCRKQRRIRCPPGNDDVGAVRDRLDNSRAAEIGVRAEHPAVDRSLPLDPVLERHHVVADQAGHPKA